MCGKSSPLTKRAPTNPARRNWIKVKRDVKKLEKPQAQWAKVKAVAVPSRRKTLRRTGSGIVDVRRIPSWAEDGGDSDAAATKKCAYKARPLFNQKVKLWKGDMTKLHIDAIVNAANAGLYAGGGICGAIHRGAGPRLQRACMKLDGCATGCTKLTAGYDLPAKYVLHTVGPTCTDPEALASCYRSCLDLCIAHNIRSVCFCCVSTGIYGYPNIKAAHCALKAVRQWMEDRSSQGVDEGSMADGDAAGDGDDNKQGEAADQARDHGQAQGDAHEVPKRNDEPTHDEGDGAQDAAHGDEAKAHDHDHHDDDDDDDDGDDDGDDAQENGPRDESKDVQDDADVQNHDGNEVNDDANDHAQANEGPEGETHGSVTEGEGLVKENVSEPHGEQGRTASKATSDNKPPSEPVKRPVKRPTQSNGQKVKKHRPQPSSGACPSLGDASNSAVPLPQTSWLPDVVFCTFLERDELIYRRLLPDYFPIDR